MLRRSLGSSIAQVLVLATAAAAFAQTTQPVYVPVERPPAEVTLPPMADLAAGGAPMLSGQASVRVSGLELVGNTIFTDEELLAAPLSGEPAGTEAATPDSSQTVAGLVATGVLTLEQLEQIRIALTLKYVNAGYINSGAVIDDQPVNAGELGTGTQITIRIVEGRLTDVDVSGERRLREGYFTGRIRRAGATPLNVNELRDGLELLRQDPRVKRINAELRPGAAPGEAALDVSVEENFPYHLSILFNNRRPPSVGAERFELLASSTNLLGFGDSLAIRYGINKGELDDWEFAGDEDFDVEYAVPITSADTLLSFAFSHSDSTLVEPPFDELDLDTDSTRYAVTLRQPFYRTPATEFAMFASITAQQTTTRLLSERIDLSPGSREGESNVAAIRIGQEFFTRNTRQALSLRSTFSFGVDAFEATINSGRTADSRFVTWLGQIQYVRRIGEGNTQLVLRGVTQLTPDSLLSPEQFAIGGVDTVRGYRENSVVRDNGFAGTVELRFPIISKRADQVPILTLAPFFDAGYGFNRNQEPVGEYLLSIGLGVIFEPNDHFNARIYYGRKLNDFSDDGGDLQDHGFHFAIEYRAF